MAPKSRKNQVAPQTIVETLEAPRLTGISTEDFVSFKQKRGVYERRVKEKSNEQVVSIPATSFLNSIGKPILAIMITAKWFPVSMVEDITEEHLQKCVEDRAQINPEDYDLAQIEIGISKISIDKNQKTLEMQVWELGLRYATTLEQLGYSTFIEKQPKLAIGHILKCIDHAKLRKLMKLKIKLRKDEFKENYELFMRETAKEARVIERHDAAHAFEESISDSGIDLGPGPSFPNKKKSKRSKGNRSKRSDQQEGDADDKTEDARLVIKAGGKRKYPDCLNPKCKSKHFMNECPTTSNEDKRNFLAAYHERKKQKGNRHVGKLSNDSLEDHSSLFSASFCDGAVEAKVLADQGSDVNIMPPHILQEISKANPMLKVTDLHRSDQYNIVDKSGPPLHCSRQVQANVMLRIRHGTNLSLRKIEWKMSDKPVSYAITGRHLLSAFGLDNRVLLAAAIDRFKGSVDVPEILANQEEKQSAPPKSIHSLLEKHKFDFGTTFHSHGGPQEDKLDDSDIYIDLGEDSSTQLHKLLSERIEEARQNGLFDTGCKRLSNLFEKYNSLFD